MAYDENLAHRIRLALSGQPNVNEKKMFGGLAFLLDGKMFIGINKEDLMVRVGPENDEQALSQPQVRPMDFTGRPMKGYVYVAPEGCGTVDQISPWVAQSLAFVSTLEKAPKSRSKSRSAPAKSGKRKILSPQIEA